MKSTLLAFLSVGRRSCGLALLLSGILNAPACAQTAANKSFADTVTFHLSHSTAPPIKVVHVMLGQREIPLDQPIHVEGEWMSQLSVIIQNVSSKTIVKTGITLSFPDAVAAANNRPIYALMLGVGRRQGHALLKRDGSIRPTYGPLPSPASVAPGAVVTLKPPSSVDMVQTKTYGLVDHIGRVTLIFDPTYFGDESEWVGGVYYVAVPAPTLWQRATLEQFIDIKSDARP